MKWREILLWNYFVSLKSGTSQDCPPSPYLFNRRLEFLTRAISQQKKIKEKHFEKEEVNFSLFAEDKIVYISGPKNSARELLQLKNAFSNMARYKINEKIISMQKW